MLEMLFGAVCCLCMGLASLCIYYRDTHRRHVILNGTVVRSERQERSRAGRSWVGYTPILEFTYHGIVYQVPHRVRSAKYGKGMRIEPNSRYHVGDSVELRVFPDNPEGAIVNDKHNLRLPLYLGVPLTILGGMLLVVCIILWIGSH